MKETGKYQCHSNETLLKKEADSIEMNMNVTNNIEYLVGHKPKVSILIPMYNSSEYVIDTLNSVVAQTYNNIEIIVVDDGSSDDSYEKVYQYAQNDTRIFLIQQPNMGAPVARNRAYTESTGEFIQYLDADDLLSSNFIEDKVRLFIKYGKTRIITSDVIRFKDETDCGKSIIDTNLKRNFEDPAAFFKQMARSWSATQISGWMISRDLHRKAGKWDESLKRNQDGELFVRLLAVSDGVSFCPSVKSYYRTTPNSITSKPISSDIWDSILRSYDSYAKAMLERSNSNGVKEALALQYSSLLYLYPQKDRSDVKERISALGFNKPIMGKWRLARIVAKIIGFRFTLIIIHLFRENYHKLVAYRLALAN